MTRRYHRHKCPNCGNDAEKDYILICRCGWESPALFGKDWKKELGK